MASSNQTPGGYKFAPFVAASQRGRANQHEPTCFGISSPWSFPSRLDIPLHAIVQPWLSLQYNITLGFSPILNSVGTFKMPTSYQYCSGWEREAHINWSTNELKLWNLKVFVRGGYYYILTNTTAVLMFGSYNKPVYSDNGGCLIKGNFGVFHCGLSVQVRRVRVIYQQLRFNVFGPIT